MRLLASSAAPLALVSPGGVEAHVCACLQPSKKSAGGGRESSTAPKQRQTVHSASNPRTSCWRHVSAFLGRLEFGAGALCGGWKPWFWSLYGHSAPNTALRAPSRCVIAALSWGRCNCAACARLLPNFGPTSKPHLAVRFSVRLFSDSEIVPVPLVG